MKVRDVMSRGVRSVAPVESIAQAARLMGENDIGALPVVEGGQIVGMVTDRDLAIRALAGGIEASAPVERVMSRHVETCEPEDELDSLLETMTRQQIRRIPVCSSTGEPIGMVTMGDIARGDRDEDEVAETLRDICRPSDLHSQHIAA